MYVRLGGTRNRIEKMSGFRFRELLLQGGLLDKKGEPKEEIEVYRGGSIFTFLTEGGERKSIPWILSSYSLDRFDERVDPEGWELENFKKNPVVQWSHDHSIPAIGTAGGLAVKSGNLTGDITFNEKEYDEFGWGIGERVRRGILRAGSVGFLVLKVEIPDPKKAGDDPTLLIYRKQELLEFSVCNVPANPFALADTEGSKLSKQIMKMEREIENLRFDLFEKDLIDEGRMKKSDRFWKGLFREHFDTNGN